jgi:phosphoglycerate dehydrogenase-like enzyme
LEKIRVLSHCGDADALGMPLDLRDRVELIVIPRSGPIPAGAAGEVLVTKRRVENIYEAAKGVQWIHIVGTGVDNLDLPRLARTSIVTNAKGAAGIPIAEWTLATMLAFEKQLPETWITSDRGWQHRPALGTLYGRTLALVGMGSIAVEAARRALPFGMRVRAVRRSDAPSPVDGVELVAALDDLLATADHLVLACALTPETRHLMGPGAFAKLKRGAHVVNVARGDLIDNDALRAALDNGTVARASLDATTPEPLPRRHWLYGHRAVRLTAHTSWNYPGADAALTQTFIENLRRYLDGASLHNVLDPELSY